MPLYQTLNNNHKTRVLTWHITESEASLRKGIELSENSLERLALMSSSIHRKGFLSIRHLLRTAGYTDADLFYTEDGKPRLVGPEYISITHSFEFTGIILSEKPVGIDIEKQRNKINRIAIKFAGSESSFIANHAESTRALTVIWGAKESMYKLYGKRGLSFKVNCHVDNFNLEDGTAKARLKYQNDSMSFDVFFHEMHGFTMVYILPE
jgi:phosphopantetheinyl transferase